MLKTAAHILVNNINTKVTRWLQLLIAGCEFREMFSKNCFTDNLKVSMS